jgi:flagellar biosynthesis/type III secretory pathway chaperone
MDSKTDTKGKISLLLQRKRMVLEAMVDLTLKQSQAISEMDMVTLERLIQRKDELATSVNYLDKVLRETMRKASGPGQLNTFVNHIGLQDEWGKMEQLLKNLEDIDKNNQVALKKRKEEYRLQARPQTGYDRPLKGGYYIDRSG